MISVAPTITDAGKNLLLRAIAGETITFTRFKIGNGELADADASALVDLLNPLVEFPINEIDKSSSKYVKLTGTFDSTFITSDFRWKELGIFCKGEDGKEVLYAYSNDGENAGMLKANSTEVVAEQSISLVIAIGNAENVTAILSESVLYVSKEEFEAHIKDRENPHKVTKEQVGLGNVPNVSTNNQTPTYTLPNQTVNLISGETLDIALGKIARAVISLILHITDYTSNPHKISAEKIGAAKEEHTHSTANIISGVLGIARGGTGVNSYQNLRSKLGLGQNLSALEEKYGGTGVSSLSGTDYTASRVRGISLQSSVPDTISNGHIVGVYSTS